MNKAYSRKALDVLDICYGWVTRLTRSFPEDSVKREIWSVTEVTVIMPFDQTSYSGEL